MVDFIQNCLDGIMLGSSYALLAIGFTLIFGVMRRLNLSYGPSIMVGAFVGTLVYVEFKANAVAIAAATVVGAVIAGIYVERLCFRAIRQGAAAASMVSSFVIWMQLEETVTVVFPDRTYPFPPLVTAGPVELGPFFFKLENVVMFACAVVMTVWLHWLLQRTRFGLAVRAVSEDKANAVAIAAATVVGAVIAGIYVERLCFRAIRQGAAAASMVSSFVIWMQLEESVTVVFPDRTYPFPPLVTAGPVELGPFFFKLENVVMFACAVVMTVWLHWLLQRTRFGLAVRAVSEDPRAARFMGINVSAVMFLAFAIASAFGGVAAYLIVAADGQITPLFGLWATFKGLIAMMLGGMGSIPGAILGGLLLGVVEAQSLWYLGAEYRDLSAYFLLFLFLVFRPGGLMGQLAVEREQAATRRV